MTSYWILYVCGTAAVASGLVAGVFLAFSDFVMKSLRTATPAGGIESMQIINRKVYGSVFLALLMGMAAASLLLVALAYLRVPGPASAWILAGGTLYLTGVFFVTMVCNVPMNKRLDVMDPNAAATASYWAEYVSSWTFWNHVRSVASAGATICFVVGSLLLVQG